MTDKESVEPGLSSADRATIAAALRQWAQTRRYTVARDHHHREMLDADQARAVSLARRFDA